MWAPPVSYYNKTWSWHTVDLLGRIEFKFMVVGWEGGGCNTE